MILPTYKSIEEKREFFARQKKNPNKEFEYLQIDTIEDLEEELDKFEKSIVLPVYRGIGEAKYKLYTSAQREWIVNEWWKQLGENGFAEFISQTLSNLTKNNMLTEYFKSLDKPYDTLRDRIEWLIEKLRAIESVESFKPWETIIEQESFYLQAKLIDAIHKSFIKPKSLIADIGRDLRHLSFLQHYGAPTPLIDFTLKKKAALFFAIDGIGHHNHGGEDIENYLSIYACEYSSITPIEGFILLLSNSTNRNSENGGLMKSLPKEWPLIFISNPLWVLMPTKTVASWSNPNIIAQEGCFFLNMDGIKPLEERKEIRKMACLDIHKSLAPYIREKYLKPKGITKESLFPDFNAIAKEAYEAFKRNPTAKISLADLPDSKD